MRLFFEESACAENENERAADTELTKESGLLKEDCKNDSESTNEVCNSTANECPSSSCCSEQRNLEHLSDDPIDVSSPEGEERDEDLKTDDFTAEDFATEDDAMTKKTSDTESQAQEQSSSEAEKSNSTLRFLYDTLELTAISLVAVMLILTVFTRHSPVNGSSMYPTILGRNDASAVETIGKDTLLISNFLYTPKKGDIVVVQTPNIKGESNVGLSLGHPIVKRIIATENDRVDIDFVNWSISINGKDYEAGFGEASYVNYEGSLGADGIPTKPMTGFYPSVIEELKNDERCDFEQNGTVFSFTVPQGQVFILGDNRNNSKDSRAIGLIDERWIIGKSIIRIYPFDRIGIVD